MSFNPATPITGAAVPGFTTPTYTIVADTAPNINGKQFAVSAVGGTQVGVDANSVSKPFTLTFFRPPQLRTLPQANPVTGVIKNVPVNTYKYIVRKGAAPAANQGSIPAIMTLKIDIPAGTDTYEPEEIKAMISAGIGCLYAQSSGIADTVISGVM